MWIVQLALSRPRTMAVVAVLIFLLGTLSIVRMPTDVFPSINLPVISVIWSYGGLAPQEMEERVVSASERAFTTIVSNIEHMESTSLAGVSVIKVYFQPGTQISQAVSQIAASSQAIVRAMPQGITPPLIMQYDASDVPILQISLSSDTMPLNEINDYTSQFVRNQLVTIKGASISPPFGGMPRLVMVDLDPGSMRAKGVTAQDVASAITSQNLILPAGNAKMGTREYYVRLNNSPPTVEGLNDLPIKTVNGVTIYVRDVANVRFGKGIQTSMVRVNGTPSVLLTVYKSGNASTLSVVDQIKGALPQIRSTLPPGLKMDLLLDQSIFVRGAVEGVVREGAIAAGLTALMILLLLGSWRSTIIVAISIPLSILSSIVIMGFMGQTLNTLTLGGLALAVGMLVDDATVEVENTTRNLGEGIPLHEAILTSAQQVAAPAFASTLAICIVFVPVAFLSGVAQSLFLPLALAVVLAMIPSYLLSRTLVTTMMQALMGKELHLYQPTGVQAFRRSGIQEGRPDTREADGNRPGVGDGRPEGLNAGTPERPNGGTPGHAHDFGLLWRLHEAVEARFEALRDRYHALLAWVLEHRAFAGGAFVAFFALSGVLLMPRIGEDFFPTVDAGQMRLHVRAPAGTRLEETGRIFSQVEDSIRQIIPQRELSLILDNIGMAGSLNFAYSNSGTIGPADGEIDISLTEKHHSMWRYENLLRKRLAAQYPQCTFYFQPADIVTQVLNFGTSAPIDIQVTGPYRNQQQNLDLANAIQKKVSTVPGIVDCYLYQVTNAPELRINVSRTRAQQLGLSQQNVAGNILVSLASSSLTAPSYWIDPSNGVQYTVTVQTPQYRVNSVSSLLNTPVSSSSQSGIPALLANVATVGRDTTPEVISHYNILPVYDVYASVQDRDLGGAVGDVQRVLNGFAKQTPRGSTVTINGQARTMTASFQQMEFGLIFAIVLVYLLLTINFESWVDPLVILMATPGALSGVLWMLYVTQTTFNVPSVMGTIMCIGVATANSILMVTFANEQREEGKDAVEASLAAGFTRFRPVIMTALAMILGMLPMSLGLAEGGGQNAPLGRAVIGGLLVATFTTLTFVPLMYTIIRHRQPAPRPGSAQVPGAPAPAGQPGVLRRERAV